MTLRMTSWHGLLVVVCLTQLGCQSVVQFNPVETNLANQLADFAYVQADQLHVVERDGTLVDTLQLATTPLAVVNYAGDQVVYVQAVDDKFQVQLYSVSKAASQPFMPLTVAPTTMFFAAGDTALAILADDQLYVYLLAQQRTIRVHEGVTAAYFLPSGQSIVYRTTSGAVLQRDLTITGELTPAVTATELPFPLQPNEQIMIAPQLGSVVDQALVLSRHSEGHSGDLSLLLPAGTEESLATEVITAGWSNTGAGVYYTGVDLIPKLITL